MLATTKNTDRKWWTPALQGVFFSLIPAISFYLMEFIDRNPFVQIRTEAHFFNLLLYELIAWMLFLLSGRAKWALRAVLFLSLAAGLGNHYVTEFRSTPLVPWDIFSIKTAASVAANYDFSLSGRIIGITAAFVVLMVLMRFFDFRLPSFRSLKAAVCRILLFCGLLCGLIVFAGRLQDDAFQTKHRLYPFLFTPGVMIKYNGYAVTFTMDLEYLIVEKPDGYQAEAAKQMLEAYGDMDADATETSAELPNIIVIMDEAFSDLGILGDFAVNQDYMPYVHSLQQGAKDTITGTLNVSVCGGNTADTEYEFLTGNTMAFLPPGSIPYQQYIHGDISSLARHLEELGYATYAQHPYYANGWQRDTVYPLMGFESLTFLPDYTERKLLRKYVSDETDFNKIIETYENRDRNQPFFLFNVTMQNHGGYSETFDNFTNTVTAEGLNNASLDQYLSLVRQTDADFEKLIKYFSEQEEPVMIVFFGDHQPNDAVAKSVLTANGYDYKNLSPEMQQRRYQVPFVIWANFDIEEETDVETSANFLGTKVLQEAGVPLSDYDYFLSELQKSYPVIAEMKTETASDADETMLEEYRKIQYYRMMDETP